MQVQVINSEDQQSDFPHANFLLQQAAPQHHGLTMENRQSLLQFLIQLGADTIPHSRNSLLLHLLNTEAILESWGASPELCRAGLFHAIYGTHSFRTAPLPPTEPNRSRVQDLIGQRAEEILYYYSVFNYRSAKQALNDVACQDTPKATPVPILDDSAQTSFMIQPETLVSIINLVVANEAEQYIRASCPISAYILTLSSKQLSLLLPDARLFILSLNPEKPYVHS